MAITVVGSVAYDSVETPSGRYDRELAGAATYFSLAASFFTDVRVIAVVGDDFGPEQEAVFHARHIDITGIERAPGKSFFWEGSYLDNLNEAKTHNTELNVFASFEPKIPDCLSRLRVPLPRQHRSRPPAPRPRSRCPTSSSSRATP